MSFCTILILILAFLIGLKLWCFWSRSKVCLIGKTAIITGGASGIGYQTALALAAKGCRVIIADKVNISTAVEGVIKETHNSNVIGKKVDLQSFKSVREFANDIIATEAQLNILICNAGIGEFANDKNTEDGLHKTMQVNYFSHFLLTHLLIDILKKSSPSRIVFTSSIAAYIADMTIDTLNPKKEYFYKMSSKITGTYSNSKLALAAAGYVFGKKLRGSGITVNVAHPGGVRTPLYGKIFKSELNLSMLVLMIVVFLVGKSPEEGAQMVIHLAQSDEVEKFTGQSFYEGMKVHRPFQLNDEFCKQIWLKSIEYTKLEKHEIKC